MNHDNVSDLNLNKVAKNIKNLNGRTPTILVLGGSFSPVHKMHIHSFEVCKKYIDSLQKEYVIGGFLIPSSESYVNKKLGKDSISLNHRNKLIDISVESSDWIVNCPWGTANSFFAGTCIRNIIMDHFKNEIQNLKLRTICGADFALRACLHLEGSSIALAREGYTGELLKYSKHFHEDFILLQSEEMKDLSSTMIRQKLKKGEELDESWVPKEVSKYLLENFNKLHQ
jgi:nicotinic acid mononucleotide adenylyltransferase